MRLPQLPVLSPPQWAANGAQRREDGPSGEICCACKAGLPHPQTPGERYCERCRPPLQVVYDVAFEKKVSWHLVISDSNSHRRLWTLVFADDDKIMELAKPSGCADEP